MNKKSSKAISSKFYAYKLKNGSEGIVDSWNNCQAIVKGVGSRYKKFSNKEEAIEWLKSDCQTPTKKIELEEGIYFDAGTGGKLGVEVRVTNENGISLLHLLMSEEQINKNGNYLAPEYATNNYGELIGCYIALKISMKQNCKKIFGDSKLVIDYWSLGHIKRTGIREETIKLAVKVSKLREQFYRSGGTISHISGDHNPADLGYHRKKY